MTEEIDFPPPQAPAADADETKIVPTTAMQASTAVVVAITLRIVFHLHGDREFPIGFPIGSPGAHPGSQPIVVGTKNRQKLPAHYSDQ